MSTIKTLALAGFAAMSLGVGAAMAQEGPSMPGPDANYGPVEQYHQSGAQAGQWLTPNQAVQSGSSDIDVTPWRPTGTPNNNPYSDQQ